MSKWYLASIVLEHRIEGDKRRVLHVNTCLIRASSAESAYEKSITFGRSQQFRYQNTKDKTVTVRFRGIQDIKFIDDRLEHGTELFYVEKVTSSESRIRLMLCEKSKLSVFKKRMKPTKSAPNYMPKDIYDMLLNAGFRDSDLYRQK
jgi:hypothetical protein